MRLILHCLLPLLVSLAALICICCASTDNSIVNVDASSDLIMRRLLVRTKRQEGNDSSPDEDGEDDDNVEEEEDKPKDEKKDEKKNEKSDETRDEIKDELKDEKPSSSEPKESAKEEITTISLETNNKESSELKSSTESSLLNDESKETSSNKKVEESTESDSSNDSSEIPQVEKPKNKKINWTEIDEEWNSVLSDAAVREKWDRIDQGMKSGIRSILRTIFPKVVAMSSDTKVSSNCTAGMLKWILSLRNLKDWSVKMLDAIGKPTAGILEGAATMFGNHRQCMNIRAYEEDDEDLGELDDEKDPNAPEEPPERKEFFRGKYCVLEFKPYLPSKPHFYGFNTRLKALQRPADDDTVYRLMSEMAVFLNFVSFRFDLCVPSLCTREDIQKIVSFLSKQIDFRGRVSRCEVQEDHLPSLNMPQLIAACWLGASITLFALCSLATCCVLRCKCKGSIGQLLYNLSWQHSWRELSHFANYQKSHLKAPALYGVRYIFMMWIMIVHTSAVVNFQFLRDLWPLKDLALSQSAQLLTKSSVQMDSLILITAFTMAFACEGASFMRVFRYVLKKLFRILPAVMIVVALMILLPLGKNYFTGGPTWDDFVPKAAHQCEQTGIYNLLFIQNFIHPDISCLPHTWLFCVEIQLAVLFIPILALREPMPQIANILNVLLILLGYVINVVSVARLNLPPTFLLTLPDPGQRNFYYSVHYFMPWTHLSTFACGILAGSFVAKIKRSLKQKEQRNSSIHYSKNSRSAASQAGFLIGWALCMAIIISVIFSYNDWVKGDLPDPMTAGFYEASQRVTWCLSQCFILYYLICVLNEQSLVYRILANKRLIYIGRLTVLAYVIHPVWQFVFLGTQHTQIYSGALMMFYSVIGNITVCYILAGILAFILEIPLCSLLIARDIVSSSHPMKPLLAKHLLGRREQQNDASAFPLDSHMSDQGEQFATFKYNGAGFNHYSNGLMPSSHHHHSHHHHHFQGNNNNNNTHQKNNNELPSLHVIGSLDTEMIMKENSKF